MLKVGLTGSIAVGKTFVDNVFRELGVPVLDADQVARDVVEPGTVGLQRVVEEFGDSVVQGGKLDRARLGSIVFNDEEKRLKLNSIIHPLVFEAQDAWLKQRETERARVAIVDAALMIESGGYKRFDKLIVVWCERDLQLQRLMRRDGLSREDAERRIASQMPQDKKKSYADHLIDTSGDFDATRRQVADVFAELSKLT